MSEQQQWLSFTSLQQHLIEHIAQRTQNHEQCQTEVPGLTFYRRETPTQPTPSMVEPCLALPVQGIKQVLLGEECYQYDNHNFLITSIELAATVKVVEASRETPYLGLTLRIDWQLMAELMLQCKPMQASKTSSRGMILGKTTCSLLDALRRLIELLDDPESIAVMAPIIQREIHYRLLCSDQGQRLRQIALSGSHSHRIMKAIVWLKEHYSEPLKIDVLAQQCQMSTSNFHLHFRQFTAMSPLRFQKWLRLNEARRVMLHENMDAAATAFRVGYESPSQFSREYSRMFGHSPKRDISLLRAIN